MKHKLLLIIVHGFVIINILATNNPTETKINISQQELTEILESDTLYSYFGDAVSSVTQDLPHIQHHINDSNCNRENLDALCTCIKQGHSTAPATLIDLALNEAVECLVTTKTSLSPDLCEQLISRLKDYYAQFSVGHFDIDVLVDDNAEDLVRSRKNKTFCTLCVERKLQAGCLLILGNANIGGNLTVIGNETISGNLTVFGSSSIPGFITNGCQPGPLEIGTSDETSLTLSTNGCTDRMIIGSNGAVTINGPDFGAPASLIVNNNAIAPAIVSTGNTSNLAPALRLIGNPPSIVGDFSLTIDGSGNVHQGGTIGSGFIVNGCQPGPIEIGTSDATSLTLSTNACSDRIVIDSAGTVTIETPDSGDALIVNGDSTFTGNILIPDTTALGTAGVIFKPSGRFIHNFGVNNTSTFIGTDAGNFTATGLHNTGVGASTLFNNANGSDNVAVGRFTLFNNAGGQQNTGVGNGALLGNVNGGGNTALGYISLTNNVNGDFNTALGYNVMDGATGSQNIGVGAFALADLTVGNNNIGIGYEGGEDLATGSSNIYIGNRGVAVESVTTRIGTQGLQTRCFIAGIDPVAVVGNAVLVTAAGQLGTLVSSRRFKKDIQDINDRSNNLMKLRPVMFHYNEQESTDAFEYGLIAEEVAEVCPDLVIYKDGQPFTVKYHVLSSLLLNELQKQRQEFEARIASLENRLEKLEHSV